MNCSNLVSLTGTILAGGYDLSSGPVCFRASMAEGAMASLLSQRLLDQVLVALSMMRQSHAVRWMEGLGSGGVGDGERDEGWLDGRPELALFGKGCRMKSLARQAPAWQMRGCEAARLRGCDHCRFTLFRLVGRVTMGGVSSLVSRALQRVYYESVSYREIDFISELK